MVSQRLMDVTNVAILVLVFLVGYRLVSPNLLTRTPRSYSPGDVVQPVPQGQVTLAERTVLIVTRSTCPFCTNSLPFYAHLISQVRSSKASVRIVALTVEPASVCEAYLKSNGVLVDAVVQISDPRLSATPTLLIVDRDGTVIQSWVGELKSQRQLEVLAQFGLDDLPSNGSGWHR
jgi:hypothetical protein